MPGLSAGEIFVDVLPRTTGFAPALTGEVTRATRGAEAGLSGFQSFGTKAFLAVGAAAGIFAVESVKAYAEHQAAVVQLQVAIARDPQLVGASTDAFVKQAEAIGLATGADHDQILAADEVLARYNLTQQQIQDLVPLVVDYAQRIGVDVPVAAGNLGRALLGNSRALKLAGINFKATGNTAADVDTIIDALKSHLGGAAEAFGQTLPGQLARAQQSFKLIEESVGQALVPELNVLLGTVRLLLPVVQLVAENFVPLLTTFLAFKAIQFLPALLTVTASGLNAVGLSAAAAAVDEAAFTVASAGMAAILAPLIIALGAFEAHSHTASQNAKDAALNTQEFAGAMLAGKASLEDINAAIARSDVPAWAKDQFVHQAESASSSVEKVRASVQGVNVAFTAATGATRNYALAQLDLRNVEESLAGGLLGVEGAILGTRSAAEQLASAQKAVNQDIKDGHKGSRQYYDDILALAQAQLGTVQSQLSLRQSVTSYANDLLGPVKKANDTYLKDLAASKGASTQAAAAQARLAGDIEALRRAQQELAPQQSKAIALVRDLGSKAGLTKAQINDLIGRITAYTGDLKGIPPAVHTNVTASTTAAVSAVRSFIGYLGTLHPIIQIGGDFVLHGSALAHHAAGAVFTTAAGHTFQAGEGSYRTIIGTGTELVSNEGALPLRDEVIRKLGRSVAEAGGSRPADAALADRLDRLIESIDAMGRRPVILRVGSRELARTTLHQEWVER